MHLCSPLRFALVFFHSYKTTMCVLIFRVNLAIWNPEAFIRLIRFIFGYRDASLYFHCLFSFAFFSLSASPFHVHYSLPIIKQLFSLSLVPTLTHFASLYAASLIETLWFNITRALPMASHNVHVGYINPPPNSYLKRWNKYKTNKKWLYMNVSWYI